MTLSMALWKAVSDRQQLLLAVWGGGRVLRGRARTPGDADLRPPRRDPRPGRPRPERGDPRVDAGGARGLPARGVPALRRARRPAAPATLARPRGRRERRTGQGPARLPRPAARPGRPRARQQPGPAPSAPGTSWPRASRTSPSGCSAAATSAACSARSRTTPRCSSATSSSAAPSAATPATAPPRRPSSATTCSPASAALEQLAARCVESVDPAPRLRRPRRRRARPGAGLADRARGLPQAGSGGSPTR